MKIFDLLLLFYPAGFRAEYGDEMRAVFAEKHRRASGPVAMAALLVEALLDVVRHAVPLHLDVLRQDLRYALRSLRRAPVFAVTVILVSALGIGANTAVFTVADRVLVRPLPFAQPDRLVRVWEAPPGYGQMEVSPPNYRDWVSMVTSFETMAAYERRSANLVGQAEGDPERIQGLGVASDVLPTLGVAPLLGRLFTHADERDDAPGTVVLGYSLWQRAFGGDPGIIGRTAVLDDAPLTVIGVMPPTFRFPNREAEFWAILRFTPNDFEDRNDNRLEVLARLREGVTLDDARVAMRGVMRQLEAAYPVENERNSATVNRLRDEIPWQARLLLGALVGASLCVLLIACTNLANLLLARASARRQELAVRSSLGAGRARLVRQLLTESLLLAGVGGMLGLALAYVCLPLLARLVPPSMPVAEAVSIDWRLLLFAVAITMVTGIGFGALPARRAGRVAVADGLRENSRSGGLRTGRLRATLVVVEVAASVVLLIASGLLVRALVEVRSIDPGFRAEGVLTARTWLSWPRYAPTSERGAFYSRVLDEVRNLPGVTHAAYTSFLPIVMGGGIWPVEMDGRIVQRTENETASLRFVTSDYFATMGIPILQGREILDSDVADRTNVAVVSQSFVDRYWPEQDPIGRTFGFGLADRTVVGVVADVQVRGLERDSEPQVYLSHHQVPDGWLVFYAPKDLAVRASGDPRALIPAIRDIIRRADPTQPVSDVQLLEEIVAQDTAQRDTQLRVLGTFAALAVLLAAIGIHGLLSFTATQRAREIGVRIALGAQRRGIIGMVVREGIVLGALGLVIGGMLGYGAGQSMKALLYGIPPADAVTFGAAIGVSLLMTLVSSLPPAVRAAMVDPNAVMREG